MTHRNRAIVVGAGIFGVAAARELRARGFAVVLLDPGPVPHPLAASTDVSKLVRGDYGADALYTGLMEAALPLWARWNATLPRPLVHFSGWSVLSTTPMAPGSFEADSFTALEARGAAPERLDAARIAHALPAWAGGGFVDGYLNPRVGWAESAEVVAQLVSEALAEGVELRVGARVTAVEEALGRVTGVRLEGDERLAAELVVVAAGAWTQKLVPALADRFETVGQPVFHLRPEDPDAFRPPRFLAWAADIGRTGWYVLLPDAVHPRTS